MGVLNQLVSFTDKRALIVIPSDPAGSLSGPTESFRRLERTLPHKRVDFAGLWNRRRIRALYREEPKDL